MKQSKNQASQYDKIFKENIEAVIPSLMQNVLGITTVLTEELPDDVQHTKERKPDVLKKVTDSLGNTFVLQIEFQVSNESEMVYRMAEYYVMLERKYKLPIEQFVLFLGSSKPKMSTNIESKHLKFDFAMIAFAELDFHIFLNSTKPEEVILSVLANFAQETPENALKQIILRLEETTEGDLSLKRYFKQLRILAQLRKLERILKLIVMDSIAKYIDEEKDVAFLIGQEKAQEKAEVKFVTNLLLESDFTVEKIAKIASVSVEFVKKVKGAITIDK
jgi:hypothetical protein